MQRTGRTEGAKPPLSNVPPFVSLLLRSPRKKLLLLIWTLLAILLSLWLDFLAQSLVRLLLLLLLSLSPPLLLLLVSGSPASMLF